MKHSSKQPRFFDAPTIAPVPHNGTTTSKEAAESLKKSGISVQNRVFFYIRDRHPGGATCEEVEIALSLKHQTAAARIHALVHMGAVVDSGKTRLTTSRRKAIVWAASEKETP